MRELRKVFINVDYEDPYVEPLILNALKTQLSEFQIDFGETVEALHASYASIQWRTYETIDFEHALLHHSPSYPHIFNAYIIRKALIRKHYLAHTILSHVKKNPSSILKSAFPLTVDFELDYAEFIDEALVEAYELQESFRQNEEKERYEREWWILKPSMSDRGQGIRLFSTENELKRIFEAWEAEMPESDEEYDESSELGSEGTTSEGVLTEGIVTSHLRHFVAQRYVQDPLLFAEAPFNKRKFHIRTYVVAAGALKVFVYDRMLALFASESYSSPSRTCTSQEDGQSQEGNSTEDLLQSLRNVHLTNTCLHANDNLKPAKEDNVYLLSSLPFHPQQYHAVQDQIKRIVSQLFTAALAHPTNFQPLPQAFEIFGVDFLCSVEHRKTADPFMKVHLLEVNAFPDFAQTGEDLKDSVVNGLFQDTVRRTIVPLLDSGHKRDSRANNATNESQQDANTSQPIDGVPMLSGKHKSFEKLQLVLDVDIGRH